MTHKYENLHSLLTINEQLPRVRVYGPESVSPDKKFLTISLSNILFKVELRNVGTRDKPIYIAWLDTHPPDEDSHKGVDPLLPDAAARQRASLIKMLYLANRLNPKIVVTPDSVKSIPSIRETVKFASLLLGRELPLIILPRAKDRESLARLSPEICVPYLNVTSPTVPKYLGITPEDTYLLKTSCPDGEGIMMLDDVYTTGGTYEGGIGVTKEALGLTVMPTVPLVVVATESVYDKNYPGKIPPHVYPIIHLPEFIGKIPD